MYEEFGEAPLLGSLLNPAKSRASMAVEWEELAPVLMEALSKEQPEERKEVGVVAHGLARATHSLTEKYHLIITNVPYLARGKQSNGIKDFSERNYGLAKNDIATVFLQRSIEFCHEGGTISMVLPQNWLFLTTYKKLRQKLLKENSWRLIARLGPKAFETPMWDFNVQLLTMSRGKPLESPLFPSEKTSSAPMMIRGIDASSPSTTVEKAELLRNGEIKGVEQDKQLENPDARVVLEEASDIELLENYARSFKGITTGDDLKFRRAFWELSSLSHEFRWLQSTVDSTTDHGGCESVVWYELMTNPIQSGVYIRATEAIGKAGVMVSQMRNLRVAQFIGTPFDTNAGAIIPHEPSHLPAIWCFCSSPEYNEAVRRIDQALKVTNATLVQVPFDLEYWQKVAEEKYPNGLPKPYSDDPNQWIFHGHPAKSDNPLQVAVARLLGYRWPAEADATMELSDEARSWVRKCEALLTYADQDGLVCIPSVAAETSAADRLHDLLAAAYAEEWGSGKLSELLAQSDHAGKTLETWLRDKFFTQHCKLFHDRPFVWQVWDGLRDGFSVLLNYHKLDRKNLEALTYTYLGDWIRRQKDDINSRVDGAEERLTAAENLKRRLELILEGESPLDIFVRWKPIEQQPMGWDPDLNDGVRLNIRPFMSVPDIGKRGAGILRDKPNIQWNKDRGKDVESAPWYHLFKGDRINEHHLTLAEKKAAREGSK
jgi:hypothetical protein